MKFSIKDRGYCINISVPEGFTECVERPTSDHVLSDNWQTDPMSPAVCWRTKNDTELDAEKDAEDEKQWAAIRRLAVLTMNQINMLRTQINTINGNTDLPMITAAQLKTAFKGIE